MPLKHNLLYPKQKAELEKKLDPLKIALLIGLVILIGLASWYIVQSARVGRLEKERQVLQEDWGKLQPREKAALEQRAIDQEKLTTANAVISRVEDRVYLAPVLQLLLEEIPPLVQLTQLSIQYDEASIPPQLTININGKVAGTNETKARGNADNLRTNLKDAFREAYGTKAGSDWYGARLRPAADITINERSLPTVDFSLQVIVPLGPEENEENAGAEQ